MRLPPGLARLAHWLEPQPPLDAVARAALQRVATTLGPLHTDLSRLEKRLRKPLLHALDYCRATVASVPGVVDINHGAFGRDPLVHALFACSDDIDTMLGRSMQLRDYLAENRLSDTEHLHALLAMRRHEKAVLGMELEGDMLRTDVPQTLLYFADHTLVAVGEDLDATREHLRLNAFDSLMATFTSHLDAIRLERRQLNDDRAMERTHFAIMRSRSSGQEIEVHTRRIAELDQGLRRITDALQPESVLDALADYLAHPEQSLRLEPVEICVDRNGVIRGGQAAAAGQADTVGFPEMVTRDRRRYVVILARIRRDDAKRALDAIRVQQERFVII
jgi:hypothetical protein